MIYSFIIFLGLFTLVGFASSFFSQKTTSDYLLANKNINPWLVGLSLFATENSGFMFIGFIGFAFTNGLIALWIPIGWYLGEFISLRLTAKKIRQETDAIEATTYNNLLSHWGGKDYKYVRYISAFITFAFLGLYASAQMSAAGKALHAVTGWDINTGVVIGAVAIIAYCIFGGIRASVWTDAAQTFAMIFSLIILICFSMNQIGGLDNLVQHLNTIDPTLLDMTSGSYAFGLGGFIAGWFFAGAGIVGQPHAMIRVMIINHVENLNKALWLYLILAFSLALLCITSALYARILMPDLINSDPELALPMLSTQILPDIFAGLFLAGLFASVMSTADSQILSSSAALSQSFITKHKDSFALSKITLILVSILSLSIALNR